MITSETNAPANPDDGKGIRGWVMRKVMGRPVGVVIDQQGGLLVVADDAGNKVWRVSAAK